MRIKNVLRKITGILGASMMTASLLSITPVSAAAMIQSPYQIDGAYVDGSTATHDTSTEKYVTATTVHKLYSTKAVSVRGYYYLYSNFYSTLTKSKSGYDVSYVTVRVDCPADSSPCGSTGTHSVTGSSGSWSGSTSVGTTSMK